MNLKNNIENYIIIFINLFLFGTLIQGLTFLKYFGLYTSIVLFISLLLTSKNRFCFKKCIKNNKSILFLLFALLLLILMSIFFSHYGLRQSIKEFRIEFLNYFIILIIACSLRNKKFFINIFRYIIIIAFFYNTIFFLYNYLTINPKFNLSIRLDIKFADYFEILYPLLIFSILTLKNKFKYIIFVILLIGIIEVILTGRRGVWLEIIGETVIFLIFLNLINKLKFKKFFISFLFLGVASLICGYFIYSHSNLIKQKINQGIEPNGRVTIVKTRANIFLKYGNILFGIGGPGGYQYQKFLNEHNAPKVYCNQIDKNNYQYYGDEPFLLQVFYKEGILGLIIFLSFSFLFVKKLFIYIKKRKNFEYRIFALSLLSSYFGYYFIRGIVEGRSFKYILLFLAFYIILSKKDDIATDI